jgi:hypothetical protein
MWSDAPTCRSARRATRLIDRGGIGNGRIRANDRADDLSSRRPSLNPASEPITSVTSWYFRPSGRIGEDHGAGRDLGSRRRWPGSGRSPGRFARPATGRLRGEARFRDLHRGGACGRYRPLRRPARLRPEDRLGVPGCVLLVPGDHLVHDAPSPARCRHSVWSRVTRGAKVKTRWPTMTVPMAPSSTGLCVACAAPIGPHRLNRSTVASLTPPMSQTRT